MKQSMRCLIGVAALALSAAPAGAHFSESMFQPRERTITGVVKDFQFMNPNAYLQIETTAGGKTTEWSLITETPSRLYMAGINRTAFTKGEQVTVRVKPLKDGRPAGRLVSVTKADGKVVTPPPPLS